MSSDEDHSDIEENEESAADGASDDYSSAAEERSDADDKPDEAVEKDDDDGKVVTWEDLVSPTDACGSLAMDEPCFFCLFRV